MIKRSLRRAVSLSKYGRAAVFFMGLLVALVLSVVLMLFHSIFLENLRNCEEEFGTYAFHTDLLDEKDMECVKKYVDVNQIRYIEHHIARGKGDRYFDLYNIDETDMELLGIKLSKGEFPSSDQEILVDQEYISAVNKSENVIGETITVKGKKYVISGLIRKNSVIISDVGEYYFVYSNEDKKPNEIYYTVNRYDNLGHSLDRLMYEGKMEDIYPNLGMYLTLGFDQDGSFFDQLDRIYLVIFVFAVTGLMVIGYNIMKYCLSIQFEAVSICNMLGIAKWKIFFALVRNIVGSFLFGAVVGYLFSLLVVYKLHNFAYGNHDMFLDAVSQINYNSYIFGILCSAGAFLIALLPLLIKIIVLSPGSFVKDNNTLLQNTKKGNHTKESMFEKPALFHFKMAIHFLMTHKVSAVFGVLGYSVATCILVGAEYYYMLNFMPDSTDVKYSYRIDVFEFYKDHIAFDRKISDYQNRFGFSEEIQLYPSYENWAMVKIKGDDVSSAYLEYLLQDTKLKVELISGKEITTTCCIVGYNEAELLELQKLNPAIMKTELRDGEAFVVTEIDSDFYVSGDFSVNIPKGETLSVSGPFEEEKIELHVVNTVDKLPVYPVYGKYEIVLIVSEEYFKKLYDEEIPQFVFVKTDKQDMREADYRNLLQIEENPMYVVNRLKEEREALANFKRVINIFVSCMVGFVLLVSFSFILSDVLVNISIQENEYAMMKALGITWGRISLIYFLENMIVQGGSLLITIAGTHIITKYMIIAQNYLYGTYLYSYPSDLVVKALIGIFIVWIFSFFIVVFKIKKIHFVKSGNC